MDSRLRWCGCSFSVFCHHYFTGKGGDMADSFGDRRICCDGAWLIPPGAARDEVDALLNAWKTGEILRVKYDSPILMARRLHEEGCGNG